MKDYPKSVSETCTKKILEQMKNSFYKIYKNDGKTQIGTGFFSYIQCASKNVPVIIINPVEVYKEDIDPLIIVKNNVTKEIKLGETRFKNKTLNIAVFEIKRNEKDKLYFLDIDERMYKKDVENYFRNEPVYAIQYIKKKALEVSYGVINNISNDSTLQFFANLNSESKVTLIFNLNNNKIIGINNEYGSNYINRGYFFKSIISGFIIKYRHNNHFKNEINILIRVEPKDVDKNIYFLGNYKPKKYEFVIHDHLKELNDIDVFINGKKYNNKNYFIPEDKGDYNIKLKFNIDLEDCSYMFANCHNIIDINFISFNAKNVTNFQYMFYKCENLETIDLFSLYVKNVNNMSCMFYNCTKLKNLDLSSFDAKRVSEMSYLFFCILIFFFV